MESITKALKALRQVFRRHKTRELHIPTKPVPASRPRVSRWGTYYGKTYTTFRDEAARLLADCKGSTSAPLAVITELVLPYPKTSERLYPRGDNDNFEKAVWDAVTSCKGVWEDDDQIIFNATYKRFAEKKEEPGIYLTLYELEP